MSEPMIRVERLTVTQNGRTILRDLNFSVDAGEIVAVVGPNGSGKTTLVRAVLGLVPYQGRVLVRGKPTREALGKIGYVPQQFGFDRTIPITIEEFIRIAIPTVTARRIRRVLLEVDMRGCEHRSIGSLSGGQMQRILIARALVNDPELLILDEAASEADAAGAKSFYDIITHLRRVHRTTVILVSHEINMVYEFADHIVCLNRDLICYGTPEQAITQKVFEKLYGKEVKFKNHKHG